ncbi:hypothetical protein XI04_27645 [Bradyrhizobium sp. CCBAU 11430]|nr:hypothetical protein [Bradyrhizobium sp. CCBAU 11430]
MQVQYRDEAPGRQARHGGHRQALSEDELRKPEDLRLPAEAARRPQSAEARPWGAAEETARRLHVATASRLRASQ